MDTVETNHFIGANMANQISAPALIRHSDGTIEVTCPAHLFSFDANCLSEAFIDHSPDIYIRRYRHSSYEQKRRPNGYCTIAHWRSLKTDVLEVHLPTDQFNCLRTLVEAARREDPATLYVKLRTNGVGSGLVNTEDFEIGVKIH